MFYTGILSNGKKRYYYFYNDLTDDLRVYRFEKDKKDVLINDLKAYAMELNEQIYRQDDMIVYEDVKVLTKEK